MTPTHRSHKNLVALGAAAVIAVYATGFVHTRAAAAAAELQDTDVPTEQPAVSPPAGPVAVTPSPAVPAARTATPVVTEPPRETQATVPDGKASPAKSTVSTKASAKKVAADSGASGGAAPPPAAPPVGTPSTPVPTPADASHNSTEAPPVSVVSTLPMPAEHYNDGLYKGYGTSRHGNISVAVKIIGGRILDAYITVCDTEFTCDVIDKITYQVAERQSTNVDRVSGATDSANAFTKAVADALSKAK